MDKRNEAFERLAAANPLPDQEALWVKVNQRLGGTQKRPADRTPLAIGVLALTVAAFAVGVNVPPAGDAPLINAEAPRGITGDNGGRLTAVPEQADASSPATMPAPYYFGNRTEFSPASSILDTPGSESVYLLKVPFTEKKAQELARIFDVPGKVVTEGDYAMSVAKDGESKALWVYGGGVGSVYYTNENYNVARDFGADVGEEGRSDTAPQVEPSDDATESMAPYPRTTPSECNAAMENKWGITDRAEGYLTELGWGKDTYELTLQGWGMFKQDGAEDTYQCTVTATHLKSSELTWHFVFAEDGELMTASGTLADRQRIGEYDLVSPREAIERLESPRFNAEYDWSHLNAMPATDSSVAGGREGGTSPLTEGESPLIDYPVSTVEVVKAEVVYSLHYQNDGRAFLVPMYRIFAQDGQVWRIMALHEKHLNMGVTPPNK